MDYSRRDFLKNASIISGATGLNNVLPKAIQKAFSINAEKGTTFRDAEHIVFLMQENRSFDHIFGSLRGVRGFNDPRAKKQPDGSKVWLQKDDKGNTYKPFHLDINTTKITWQGGLPHDWPDQVGARNHGKYDRWIPNKSVMTMGYYDRTDLPFYYAFADAFTVCDHNFCSSLTGTTPNRLFFWTGNIRPHTDGNSIPAVFNSMAESRNNAYVDWETFPELLEKNGISWKIYQNELWTSHLEDNHDYWLGNYGDNAIEYIKRYNVKLSPYFRKHGDKTVTPNLSPAEVQKKYNALTPFQKALVDKAFSTNIDDNDVYLQLSTHDFTDDKGNAQKIDIPHNDLFLNFRKDVQSGNLPQVSWLVAPQAFSDHTSSPYYGTWYVSEALDILTQNPEAWKKTIFILNYDENDGYFDHLCPFTAPHPNKANSGLSSEGINTESDYYDDHKKHNSPIGLGYRVPMIIASPWSKGGYVNSQVFDHTSTLTFLEDFFASKGKNIHSSNISSWRRAISGNLTSAFRPYNGENIPLPDFEQYETTIHNIQNAQNKPIQNNPDPLSTSEILKIDQAICGLEKIQEKGTRPACALPYINFADYSLQKKGEVVLQFQCGEKSGSAFNVYTSNSYENEEGKCWNFALEKGKKLSYPLLIENFKNQHFDLKIQGPNGFFRHFYGNKQLFDIDVKLTYEKKKSLSSSYTGNLVLHLTNLSNHPHVFVLQDKSYGKGDKEINIGANETKEVKIILQTHHWYDVLITVKNIKDCAWHYAGHVENGQISISDPLMGNKL